MSYVDLKHLLAELALEAMRRPGEARWAAVAGAYAELASGDHSEVGTADCLNRASVLAERHTRQPSAADIRYLVDRGLLSERAGPAEADEPAGAHRNARADRITLAAPFLPHFRYFQRHAPRLLKALGELRDGVEVPGIARDVAIGAALFNAGLFFECHEWFEGLWRATRGPEKDFYHGIVQAAASFYHYEKDNRHGCRTLMRKGRRRLASYPGRFLGVDLAGFEDALAQWAVHFDGGPRPSAFPRIEFGQPEDRVEKAKGAPRG
jgi:hypothetical protein